MSTQKKKKEKELSARQAFLSQDKVRTTGGATFETEANRSRGGDNTKSRQEIETDENQEIQSARDARMYLDKVLLTIPDRPADPSAMATALFQITQLTGMAKLKQVVNAIRAVAFLIEEREGEDRAAEAREDLNNQLEDQCSHSKLVMERIGEKVEAMINKTFDKINKKVADVTTSATSEIRGACETFERTTAVIAKTSNTYKEVVERGLASGDRTASKERELDPRARARIVNRARQVLIDLPLGSTGRENLKNSSNEATLEKANQAIRAIDESSEYKLTGMMRLRNGGLLLEANSEEAAAWIREPQHRNIFAKAFDNEAEVKARAYNVMAYFVPLTFQTEGSDNLREIEEMSGLPEGAITKARYVKPAHRRSPTQMTGHVILTFSDPKNANRAIVNGLTICQQGVRAGKCKREPLRCMKCQGWNHIAAECPSRIEVCGGCRGQHRTDSCDNKDKTRCTSCGTEDHPSWSRECPTFLRRCETMNERTHENNMPYFPTDEPWTLAQEPPRAPRRQREEEFTMADVRIDQTNGGGRGHTGQRMRQTVLPFTRFFENMGIENEEGRPESRTGRSEGDAEAEGSQNGREQQQQRRDDRTRERPPHAND